MLLGFSASAFFLPPQPLEFHPVPLPSGEEGEYVLALKQELRGAMRQLPYFIRPAVPKRGQFDVTCNLYRAPRAATGGQRDSSINEDLSHVTVLMSRHCPESP